MVIYKEYNPKLARFFDPYQLKTGYNAQQNYSIVFAFLKFHIRM